MFQIFFQPEDVDDLALWRVIFEIISEPSPRERLRNINSLDHVKKLIQESKNIIILTGAGVSYVCYLFLFLNL